MKMDAILKHLILKAVGETGTYDPDECLYRQNRSE